MLRSWVRSPSSPPAKYQAAKRICSAAFLFPEAIAASGAMRSKPQSRTPQNSITAPMPSVPLAYEPLSSLTQPRTQRAEGQMQFGNARYNKQPKHRHKAAKPAQVTERALHSCLVLEPYSSASASTTTGSSVASSSIKLPNRGWPSWLSSTMPVRTSTYW